MLKKKRWQLVFLLFLAGVVNYLDRSALSVAAPLVTQDLSLTPADLGLIFSSFFFGYAIFNFIGGWASDKLGGKRVFTLAMGVWSAFCALTAAATGFVSLLVIRVFFGVGEGPLSSTINKVVNNWFPASRGGERRRLRQLRHAARRRDRGTDRRLAGRRVRLESRLHRYRRARLHLARVLDEARDRDAARAPDHQRRGIARDRGGSRRSDRGPALAAARLLSAPAGGAGHRPRVLRLQLHPVLLPDLVPELSDHGAGSQHQGYEHRDGAALGARVSAALRRAARCRTRCSAAPAARCSRASWCSPCVSASRRSAWRSPALSPLSTARSP